MTAWEKCNEVKTENYHLMRGDCLELMKIIPNKSVDLILCDLPYGTTSCAWDTILPFDKLWEQYNRIIKDNCAIVLFGSEPFSSYLRMSNIKNYKYDWIWDKHNTNGFLNAKKRPLKRHEVISIFCYENPRYYPQMEQRGQVRNKGSYNHRIGNGDMVYGKFKNIDTRNNTYYPTDILSFSNADQTQKQHPTEKPVELLAYLIRTYTQEGETVLDNCMGSGSTGVACRNTERKFIGIELDEKYFDIAKQRIENEARPISVNGTTYQQVSLFDKK